FAAICCLRAAARALARTATAAERVLFVGRGRSAVLLEKKMRIHPEYRLEPVGYIASEQDADEALQMPYLGPLDGLEELCVQLEVDRVLLVSPTADDETLTDAMRRLGDLDVRVSVLPQIVDVLGSSVEIDDVEGVTVLGISSVVLTRSSRF